MTRSLKKTQPAVTESEGSKKRIAGPTAYVKLREAEGLGQRIALTWMRGVTWFPVKSWIRRVPPRLWTPVRIAAARVSVSSIASSVNFTCTFEIAGSCSLR